MTTRHAWLGVGVISSLALFARSVTAASAAIAPFTSPTPLTAAQFHAVGQAAGAKPLGRRTPAAALGEDQSSVDSYATALCGGTQPLFEPTLFPYANDVPAYEAIFAAIASRPGCSATRAVLDHARGVTAWYMAANQVNTDALRQRLTTTKINGFCDALQTNKRITKPALVGALEEAHIIDEGSHGAAGFAIGLAISRCNDIVDLLG